MNSKTTKTNRLVPVALLAIALALIVGVAGFMMPVPSAKAEDAAPVTKWHHSRSAPFSIIENADLVNFNDNSVFVNETDILSLPGNTAYFQMRVDKSAVWSALMLLDKFDVADPAEGKAEWKRLSFNDTSATTYKQDGSVDVQKVAFDNHMRLIFCDNGGQLFSGHNSTCTRDGKTAPRGVINPHASWSDSLVGVEIHIGTGTDGDMSYIKANGVILCDEDNADVWTSLKASDFNDGCFIGAHFNLIENNQIYLSEVNTPITTSVDAALKGMIDYTASEPVAVNASFTVRNLTTPSNAVLKINGVAVDSQYYETAAVDGDDKALTYTVKKEFWETKRGALSRNSYLTVEDENGKAVVMLTVQNAPPPVWEGKTSNSDTVYKELDGVSDTSFKFTYEAAITADNLTIRDGVSLTSIDGSALIAGTDYTLAAGSDNEYTLTFTEAYLTKATETYRGRAFRIEMGEDNLKAQVYVKSDAAGWITRPVDITGEISKNDYYTVLPFATFKADTYSSRTYYNTPVDVRNPIFIETGDLMLGSVGNWLMLNVAKSRRELDYFKDSVADDSALQALFFQDDAKIHRLHGFTAGDVAFYVPTPHKGNLIELYFGTNSDDGYMKVNGVEYGKPAAKQSDFTDDKAYISWLSAFSSGFDFKLNSNINAIAIADKTDDNYVMDLGAATDFSVTLANYGATDTIQVKSGETALALGTDYTFNAETGALTIKTAYFESIPFSKEGVISVWNDTAKTGTQFRLTYSSSNMKASQIAFATKGNVQNATFTMPEEVTVNMLLDGDSEEVNTTNWDFANGKLTVHKEVIGDKYGATEFIAVAGKDLYPLYVYVQDFKDGGLKESGEGSIVAGNGAYLLNSDVSYMFEKAYNLTSGLTAKVDFKEIPGYYGGGINYTKTGYVQFAFYDPYSNSTFKFRLYTNTPDSEVSPSETALYGAYEMTGGNTIPLNPAMINVAGENSQNNSALGVHGVTFSVNDKGALVIKVDNAREITVSAANLGTFNLSASILTVSTPASQGDDKMALGLQLTDGVAEIDYTAITVTNDEKKPGNTGCGCGSEMVGASTVLGAVLVLIAALVLVRRKKATDK